jgi:hypothetical protein
VTDTARRAQLNEVKLSALAAGRGAAVTPGEFGGGAAGMSASTAWVLLDDGTPHGLGAALAWAVRNQAAELQLIAPAAKAGALARQAEAFALPISVWTAEERALCAAQPAPLPAVREVLGAHLQFAEVIRAAGAEPVIEHGVLSGEVFGLEVCRAVTDAVTGVHRLDVGIGTHDREAFQMVHGDRPTGEALADVVTTVAAVRRPGAAPHPLNRIAVERALRCRVVAAPELVGASSVTIAPPPTPRPNLKDVVPCVAIADFDGQPAALVFTSGVHLDVVPFAADVRTSTGLAQVIIVLREADLAPVQRDIAATMRNPVEFATVSV